MKLSWKSSWNALKSIPCTYTLLVHLCYLKCSIYVRHSSCIVRLRQELEKSPNKTAVPSLPTGKGAAGKPDASSMYSYPPDVDPFPPVSIHILTQMTFLPVLYSPKQYKDLPRVS